MNYNMNLDDVIQRVEDARLGVSGHHIVKIVAVSKYSQANDVRNVFECGQRAFGENRVQDLENKISLLDDIPLEWHFMGRLQKNKINKLIDLNPFLMQSCESFELAHEIDKRLEIKNRKMNILLQINSANEKQKNGIEQNRAIEEFLKIRENCKNLNLLGVMSIGAMSEDVKLIQKSFEDSYDIFEKLKSNGAKYCSMGMSGDFELAIKCGSNMVRVGSSIFKR